MASNRISGAVDNDWHVPLRPIPCTGLRRPTGHKLHADTRATSPNRLAFSFKSVARNPHAKHARNGYRSVQFKHRTTIRLVSYGTTRVSEVAGDVNDTLLKDASSRMRSFISQNRHPVFDLSRAPAPLIVAVAPATATECRLVGKVNWSTRPPTLNASLALVANSDSRASASRPNSPPDSPTFLLPLISLLCGYSRTVHRAALRPCCRRKR